MAGSSNENTNGFELSDEDFLAAPPPVIENNPKASEEEDNAEEEDKNLELGDDANEEEDTSGSDEPEDDDDSNDSDDPVNEEDDVNEEDASKNDEEGGDSNSQKPDGDSGDSEDQDELEEDKPTEDKSDVDYKSLYEKVMKPFKANGKMINIESPEEAISLMQMGANYTRKMQQIQPYRKMLTMLENNNLLDEDKLSFFIDLDAGNKGALEKFLKDKEIDPLTLDIDGESEYQKGDHSVSDAEVMFHNVVEDITSQEGGMETLNLVSKTWDQDSKKAITSSPGILEIIHEQRQSGVYQLIVDEMDRQKALGKLNSNIPFIQAYKTVGDELTEQGKFQHLDNGNDNGQSKDDAANSGQNSNQQESKTITRKAKPKGSQVANSDQAKAAGLTRGSKSKPKDTPKLPPADDEFLKSFEGRV